MNKNDKANEPDLGKATDAEVASAAKQLGVKMRASAGSSTRLRKGEVVQRLGHGRSHAVTLEYKSRIRSKSA
jgi:hypothetical protein